MSDYSRKIRRYADQKMEFDYDASGLNGTAVCAHAVLPQLVERNSGVIINMSLILALRVQYSVPYGATKAAVERFTTGLARELRACGERHRRLTVVVAGADLDQPHPAQHLDVAPDCRTIERSEPPEFGQRQPAAALDLAQQAELGEADPRRSERLVVNRRRPARRGAQSGAIAEAVIVRHYGHIPGFGSVARQLSPSRATRVQLPDLFIHHGFGHQMTGGRDATARCRRRYPQKIYVFASGP